VKGTEDESKEEKEVENRNNIGIWFFGMKARILHHNVL
jgi:hypothetical protein